MITYESENNTCRKKRGQVSGERFMKNGRIPREFLVQQIKEARKAQGMTQQELAELAGTKKSNISRLESGLYNPSLDFLIKIADGLGKQIRITIQ